MTTRSISRQTFRFAGAVALLGVLAIAACNRAPTPPEKLAIAPAVPGTASGFVVLKQDANADRNQEASDNRFVPTVAYAFIDRSSPEYYDLVLLEKPLDNAAIAAASDPSEPIEAALRAGANGAWLMFDGEGSISGSFRLHAGGKSVQFGGSGSGQVRGVKREGDRLTGHVHYFSSFFSDHMAIDAAFDAPLVMAPQGKPMPADGGEPGEAFLETAAAMRAGDVDKLVKLMAPERAKMIEAERGKPDFAENIEMLKMMAPSEDVQVTGGTSFGERVVLETKGTDDGKPYTATVEMAWEAGGWRMGSTRQRMGSDDGAAKADAPKEPKADKPSPADLVPVLADDGVVGKGFQNGEATFAPTHAFVVDMPADYGENRMIMMLAEVPLEAKNATALWDEKQPFESLFAGNKAAPSLWLNLSRDESGEVSVDKAYFVDSEGSTEDTYVGFNAIESGGKLLGTLSQSGSRNDVAYEGLARFNLPVGAAP